MLFIIGREEVLRVLDDDSAEQDQGEEVRDGHEPVADVRRIPEELHADQRAGRAEEHMQHPVDLHPARAEEEGKGGLAVGVPAEDSGQAEQNQRDDDNNLPDAAEILAEGRRGQHGAVRDAAVPDAADHDDEVSKKTSMMP